MGQRFGFAWGNAPGYELRPDLIGVKKRAMNSPFENCLNWLAESKSIVVMTGAGVSAESNIPTFRDALEGLWAQYDPYELATPEAFASHPERVTRWYDERRRNVLQCEPNAGHRALAELQQHFEARARRFTLITQNVDGLHQRAGSDDVVELHGSLLRWRCHHTGRAFTDLPVPFETYPPPSETGGRLRPDVVWFGEMLPEDALRRTEEALRASDLYMAVGTSGVVYPAAGFGEFAKRFGAKTVEVNLDHTSLSAHFDLCLLGKSGEVLPKLVEGLAKIEAHGQG